MNPKKKKKKKIYIQTGEDDRTKQNSFQTYDKMLDSLCNDISILSYTSVPVLYYCSKQKLRLSLQSLTTKSALSNRLNILFVNLYHMLYLSIRSQHKQYQVSYYFIC